MSGGVHNQVTGGHNVVQVGGSIHDGVHFYQGHLDRRTTRMAIVALILGFCGFVPLLIPFGIGFAVIVLTRIAKLGRGPGPADQPGSPALGQLDRPGSDPNVVQAPAADPGVAPPDGSHITPPSAEPVVTPPSAESVVTTPGVEPVVTPPSTQPVVPHADPVTSHLTGIGATPGEPTFAVSHANIVAPSSAVGGPESAIKLGIPGSRSRFVQR